MPRNSQHGKNAAMSRLAKLSVGSPQQGTDSVNRTQVFGPEYSTNLAAALADEADIPTRENPIVDAANAARPGRAPNRRGRPSRTGIAAAVVVVGSAALAAGLLSADRNPRATTVAPADAAPNPTYEPTTTTSTSVPITTLRQVSPVTVLEVPTTTMLAPSTTTTTARTNNSLIPANTANIPASVIETLEAVQALRDSLQATTSTVAQTTTSLAPTTTIRPTTSTTAMSTPVSSTIAAR